MAAYCKIMRGNTHPFLLWFAAVISTAMFLGFSQHSSENVPCISRTSANTKLAYIAATSWQNWESKACPTRGGGGWWVLSSKDNDAGLSAHIPPYRLECAPGGTVGGAFLLVNKEFMIYFPSSLCTLLKL